MNYLAHLFLSEDKPEARIGNLLGDFINSDELTSLSLPYRRGFMLHHKIDAFTDTHPIFQQSRQRVSLERRRFAGILIDLFYDHFLAVHWLHYASQPLPEFAQSIYAALTANYSMLPVSLQHIAPRMIQEDWLVSYQHSSGIQAALLRVSARMKRQNDLASAITELETNYQTLQADFLLFFPQLFGYVSEQISA